MSSRNNFEIEGLREFITSLSNMEGEGRLKVKTAVDNGGDLLLNATRQKCGSDRIKRSLQLKREAPTGNSYTISNTLTWGDDVRDFAAPYELGHGLIAWGKATNKYIQGKPFLRPAADENADRILSMVEDAFDEALKEFGG